MDLLQGGGRQVSRDLQASGTLQPGQCLYTGHYAGGRKIVSRLQENLTSCVLLESRREALRQVVAVVNAGGLHARFLRGGEWFPVLRPLAVALHLGCTLEIPKDLSETLVPVPHPQNSNVICLEYGLYTGVL